MKVILLQDVEDLGKKYEVKEVADGHARNMLLPQKLVRPATKEALEWLESQKETIEKQAQEDLKQAQELASKVDGYELAVLVKVGEHQELFESVDTVRIAKELKDAGFDVKKSQIKLPKAIKELGEFPVKLVLDHNLEAEVKVIVSPSEDSAATTEE